MCTEVVFSLDLVSKSRIRLFSASRAPTSLWPSSSEAGWLRRSGADGTRPERRPPPGDRSPELRAPACAKSFLGAVNTRDGFSRSVGCRSGQDEATGRVHDENEQRGHCSAQLSDAVAVLLTALTAVKRGVAPHCWLEKVLAAARSRARGDHHTSRGRETKPCGLPGAAAGAPGRRACEEANQTDTKEKRFKVAANPWRTHILDGRHGA